TKNKQMAPWHLSAWRNARLSHQIRSAFAAGAEIQNLRVAIIIRKGSHKCSDDGHALRGNHWKFRCGRFVNRQKENCETCAKGAENFHEFLNCIGCLRINALSAHAGIERNFGGTAYRTLVQCL